MKLLESVKSLILEIASVGDVTKSIKDRRVMTIYYDGDIPGGKGWRRIEPVCLGYSKNGNLLLRAWDIDGASHTDTTGKQPLPGWRLFRLDKIFTYRPTTTTFDTPRPNYNKDGDKTMSRVLLNAKFNTDINE